MSRQEVRDSVELSFLEWQRVRRSARRLASHADPKLAAIGAAIDETLNDRVAPNELEPLSAVERRRATLLASTDEIEVLDYGAGSPGTQRSQEEMERGVVVTQSVSRLCRASKRGLWATLLFKLVRHLQPRSCVELGTCFGISGAYQAVALDLNAHDANAAGSIVTLEGSPAIAEIAIDTFDGLGIKNARVVVGPFHATLEDVLRQAAPVDYFFNDGHHDGAAVHRYLDQATPHLAPDAVVVFDDISWSAGMRQAWEEIERDPRVRASVDLDTMGIAVIGAGQKQTYRIALPVRSAAASPTRRA